ncbi:hypothetical protein [Sphingosinicella sp. BN140058]|uniref:hypothetical protein n=1 Tax=Sphingosinicella sp. BN140058 TaxID=1892855 RepID=UPI00101017EE|nr:hypothetical protein [Sphingosinicella sp. BN140058]QAY78161.1 hypothetical protein ETR14_17725 [Sphingosinicella sp. BN140058]
MAWMFDQSPNVACIATATVFAGDPVLVVTHYEDDHSWAFLDGRPINQAQTWVVAMSQVIELHPDLQEIADLPPGWTAWRASASQPWLKELDPAEMPA